MTASSALLETRIASCANPGAPALSADRRVADALLPAAEGLPITELRWRQLVAEISAGDPAGLEALYAIFSRGIRFQLCRQLGAQDLDDRIHDVFLIIVDAIRKGELREPDRLMGFIRTVVRRYVAADIDSRVSSRREQVDLECGVTVPDLKPTPEERAISDQQSTLMSAILGHLSDRDREVLTRFYLKEQTQDEICDAMDLTETQFRLLKSRAKQRFAEIGRRKVQIRSLSQIFVRKK